MLTFTEHLRGQSSPLLIHSELALPYELREKARQRARLSSNEDAALFLPRGTVLRNGDYLRGTDELGRSLMVRIVAAPEPVLEVECHDADEFARCAYHLGNRHTPVQIIGRKDDGHYALRIRADHVLADMLDGLGAHSHQLMAPFEPEAGAYGGHSHVGSHDHEHGHSPGHEQDHGSLASHPGRRMPVHEPKIHRPDPAKWKGTQDK